MNLEIKKSQIPNAGMGLYTHQLIKRGEVVVEYKGEVITWAQCQKRNDALEGVGAYYFYISDRKCVDALHTPEALARYANDAAGIVRIEGYRNNARFEVIKGKPYIVASRNIKPGEEVFVSYGKVYWDAMRKNGFDPKHKGTTKKLEPEAHGHHLVPKREAKH